MSRPDHAYVLRQLRRLGWSVVLTKKSHYKCYPPNGGRVVVLCGTAGDWRALKNAISDLIKTGAAKKSDFFG